MSLDEVSSSTVADSNDQSSGLTTKVKAFTSVAASIGALLVSIGTFAKSCDHSLTANAYNTLSKNISALSDQEAANHNDLLTLRGYLDGLARNPIPVVPLPTPAPSPSPQPQNFGNGKSQILKPLVRPSQEQDSIRLMVVPSAEPVPSIHAAPAPIKPPTWSQVETLK